MALPPDGCNSISGTVLGTRARIGLSYVPFFRQIPSLTNYLHVRTPHII
jgi:hypothetical protein